MYRISPKLALRHAALTASAAAIVCLSGCAGISGTAVPSSLTTTVPVGSVHGGQQPIQGAHVFLFAASDTNYTTAPSTCPSLTGVAPTYKSASCSLLTSLTGTQDTDSASSTFGDYYVTTGPDGGFSYGGAGLTVTCPSGNPQIYLLATGGNPTGVNGGAPNGAISLGAALGPCSNINASTFSSINEVTTAAMAFALNPFMKDGAHIGAPVSDAAALTNAFSSILNLVDNSTGTALATTPSGNGTAPQTMLNTLANIIAPCINSSAGNSASCSSLFSSANASGTAAPLDTMVALRNIAQFPGNQVANLYSLASATPPFQPALAATPAVFSLGITFTAPNATPLSQPGAIVIDGNGNIFVANCPSCVAPNSGYNPAPGLVDNIVKFAPDGHYVASFGGTALHRIQGIAIDRNNNIWTVNQAYDTHTVDEVIELNASGAVIQTIDNAEFGLNSLQGIAFDASDNVWITAVNSVPGTNGGAAVFEYDPTGTTLMGGGPFYNPNTNPAAGPAAIVADNVGVIWVVDSNDSTILGYPPTYTTTATAGLRNYIITPSATPDTLLGIAIDANNNLVVTNTDQDLSSIHTFNTTTNHPSTTNSKPAIYQAELLAIDGANEVLVPNCKATCSGSGAPAGIPDNLLRLDANTGLANTGASTSSAQTGAEVAGFNQPAAVAIDGAGSAWVSNHGPNAATNTGSITQVVGYAAPTTQPLAAAVRAQTIGVSPQ